MSWVPLHVHSQYSILDSTASVEALVKKAREFGMPALASAGLRLGEFLAALQLVGRLIKFSGDDVGRSMFCLAWA